MRSAVGDWLLGRVPLAVAAIAFALGQRCVDTELPGRATDAFVAYLGERASVAVEAPSLRWERSGGRLCDLLFGRHLLFLARAEGAVENDVFRARVRLSSDGQPLGLVAVTNLTRTPDGAEAGLSVSGSHAAYVALSGGAAVGLSVLELDGVRREDVPGGWLNRGFLRLGSLFGGGSRVSRTHLRFSPARQVTLEWQGDRLRVERDGHSAVWYDAIGRRVEGDTAGLVVAAQPVGSADWLHTLRGLLLDAPLSSWFLPLGPRTSDPRGAAELNGGTRRAAQARQTIANAEDEPRGDAPWPPLPLAPLHEPASGGEGQWVPAAAATSESALAAPFFTTHLRAEPSRPSSSVQLVAIDLRRLELHLQAGHQEPRPTSGLPGLGSLPRVPSVVSRVRATFNGALGSRHGAQGMVVQRHTLVPPVERAATVVVLDDRSVGFGVWPPPREVRDRVVSLRQNLDPLLARGLVNPARRRQWGEHPLLDGVSTERSALCRTGGGQLFYAFGKSLSAESLGRVLLHAGCSFVLHLDTGPRHSGFFFHEAPSGEFDALRSTPAFPGIEVADFARGSGQDFFYLLSREASAVTGRWLPDPGVQPPPESVPAISSSRESVGSLSIELRRFLSARLSYEVIAGSAEPVPAGRPAPRRRLGDDAPPVFALNLGHTTEATRYGLSFQAEATLPLRLAYATLLLTEGAIDVVPEGRAVTPADGSTAVQLPQLMWDGVLSPRASEPGSLRRRGALCVTDDGNLLVASARLDTSAALAIALRTVGCRNALELDRGSQDDVFLHRAGTRDAPKEAYRTTVLLGVSAPAAPGTFEW